jgi:hypothetical protein
MLKSPAIAYQIYILDDGSLLYSVPFQSSLISSDINTFLITIIKQTFFAMALLGSSLAFGQSYEEAPAFQLLPDSYSFYTQLTIYCPTQFPTH